MRAARLARNRSTDLVLRSILQAFDNETAVESNDRARPTYGLGGDIARKELTDADLQKVLLRLIEERMQDAHTLEAHGQQAQADLLSQEAETMRKYLV